MSLFTRAQLPPLTISGGTGVGLLRQAAGQLVTPDTAKQKVAYGASVDLIAGLVSTLPVTVRRKRNGVMVAVESPAVLLDPEGLGHGLEDFTYMWTAQLLTRGNNFCYPGTLDAQARPSVVRLLDPNRLSLVASDAGYDVRLPGGETKPLYGPAHLDGVKHSRAYAVPGQVLGESQVAHYFRTLGLALASEQFGADFFGDGAHPTAILTTDGNVTEEQARTVKDRFMASMRGNREPAVLGGGVEYKAIQVSPEESQFLATQGYTDAQVCRMFGANVAEMLGYETGGKLTYANVQQNLLQFLILTLNKWLVRYERFLSDYLLAPDEVATIDRNALLQMTPNELWNFYKTRLSQGAMTINEARLKENEPPVAWGDAPYMPALISAAAMVQMQADVAPEEGTVP